MGYPVDSLSGIPILTLSSRHLVNCRLVKSLDLLKCLPRNLSKGKYVTRRVENKATFQQAPLTAWGHFTKTINEYNYLRWALERTLTLKWKIKGKMV